MVEVKFCFNEDHACFQDDFWYEIDRMCNIMKQNIYQNLKDENGNTPALALKIEADGPIIESNGNNCGHWEIVKRLGETC